MGMGLEHLRFVFFSPHFLLSTTTSAVTSVVSSGCLSCGSYNDDIDRRCIGTIKIPSRCDEWACNAVSEGTPW